MELVAFAVRLAGQRRGKAIDPQVWKPGHARVTPITHACTIDRGIQGRVPPQAVVHGGVGR